MEAAFFKTIGREVRQDLWGDVEPWGNAVTDNLEEFGQVLRGDVVEILIDGAQTTRHGHYAEFSPYSVLVAQIGKIIWKGVGYQKVMGIRGIVEEHRVDGGSVIHQQRDRYRHFYPFLAGNFCWREYTDIGPGQGFAEYPMGSLWCPTRPRRIVVSAAYLPPYKNLPS